MAVLVASLVASQFVSGARELTSAVTGIVKSLATASNEVAKMQNTLVTSSGSVEQAAKDLLQLRTITDKLGTSLTASAVPFAKFAAAADNLSRDESFAVFEGISTALAATHANAQTASGAFLALQQIVSKGKVNMQDLRRQLAEHIPGAMEMAVKAFGDGTHSYEEFEDAVSAGEVNTTAWINKFASLMKDKFAPAAKLAGDTLDAEVKRMGTSFTIMKASIADAAGATDNWKRSLKEIREEILNNAEITASLANATGQFSEVTEKQLVPVLKPVAGFFADVAEGAGIVTNKLSIMGDIGVLTLSGYLSELAASTLELVGAEDLAAISAERMTGKYTELGSRINDLTGETGKANIALNAHLEKMGKSITALIEAGKAADKYKTNMQGLNAIMKEEIGKNFDEILAQGAEHYKERYEQAKKMFEDTGKASDFYKNAEKARLKQLAETYSEVLTTIEEREAFVAEGLKKIFTESEAIHTNSLRTLEELNASLTQYSERILSVSGDTVTYLKKVGDQWITMIEKIKLAKPAVDSVKGSVVQLTAAMSELEASSARAFDKMKSINAAKDSAGYDSHKRTSKTSMQMPAEFNNWSSAQRERYLQTAMSGTSYHYFSTGKWTGTSSAMQERNLQMQASMNNNYNFNITQKMSRSDVVSMMEEMKRIGERT